MSGWQLARSKFESRLSTWLAPKRGSQKASELGTALAACKFAFIGVGVTSGIISVLYLTGSFYMLEVYDRVIPGRSIPTLVGLSVLALTLYLFQGALDIIRTRILVRIGAALDSALSPRVYDAMARAPLRLRSKVEGLQPLRDLDQIRGFLSSLGLSALFDLPWIPFYLLLCFIFHFWIGMAALLGAIVLVAMTLYTDAHTREPTKQATEKAVLRQILAEGSRRNAEVLQAMGMRKRVGEMWGDVNTSYMTIQREIADMSGNVSGMSKVFRMILQSAVLGVGAFLVVNQQATAGVMIAASILSARALAPVELAIAHWKAFVGARQSWERLHVLLQEFPEEIERLSLPRPKSLLTVENVSVVPPGGQRVTVQDISFQLQAGHGLGIIGPSASGKSSLARTLVGVWAPVRGKVRLDGAALDHWTPEALGPHIGYVPQDIELFAGSVAQNIARFELEPDAGAIIAAAQAAGVHEMILQLPNGYETQIGEAGTSLSAGQRQRVALARALYRDPFLLVLDEPNSNLDAVGDQALVTAVSNVRARGGIVVVIAHRPIALAGVDLLLVMSDGRMQFFGPKDEALRKMVRRSSDLPAAGQNESNDRQPAISASSSDSNVNLRVVGDGRSSQT